MSNDRSIDLPSEDGNSSFDLHNIEHRVGAVPKNDFIEKMISFLFSDFLSGFSLSFFASCCSFFIIWHLPLQCIIGLALFSQFLAYFEVLA
jgi:hypothetical protein